MKENPLKGLKKNYHHLLCKALFYQNLEEGKNNCCYLICWLNDDLCLLGITWEKKKSLANAGKDAV